jgi:acetoin utilization deacetylase AcuC-like enzyme
MRVVYSPIYRLDLGAHVWPTDKYALTRQRLLDSGVLGPGDLVEATACTWEDLALVHTSAYLEKVRVGTLTPGEIAQLELPWSPAITEGFRVMVGGTVAAARYAVGDGASAHLGGGLHHAFPDHGEGFCLFNDVAVAIRRLQVDRLISRAAVVDADVHHGNGTAFMFTGDPSVFTFSIHQQHNYPAWKPASSLDIGLPDGAGDTTYLRALERGVKQAVAHEPDLICYLAGADPFEEDQLGGLRVSKEGLRLRDRLVFDAAGAARIPICVVLAGGYARRVEDTVDIHATTIRELAFPSS